MRRKGITFAVDVGSAVGLGHLRRCLTLAQCLKAGSWEITFIAHPAPYVAELIRAGGHTYWPGTPQEIVAGRFDETLCDQSQVLFIDSYALSPGETAGLHYLVDRIATIDDFNQPRSEVDILINFIPGGGIASPGQTCLFGPQFAILRPEFRNLKQRATVKEVNRVLLTMGGSDPLGVTPRALSTLDSLLPATIELDVVRGPFFSDNLTTEGLRHPGRVVWHDNPSNMADLMQGCDLCITAGGQTLFELAAAGLPAIVVQAADNQSGNIEAFTSNGTVEYGGWGHAKDLERRLANAVACLVQSPGKRLLMAQCGQQLVDGKGASRISDFLTTLAGD